MKYNPDTNYIGFFDEVGRGCLFGPVVVGLVLLPEEEINNKIEGVTDSKRMTAKLRRKQYFILKKKVLYQLGYSTVDEIYEYGINKCIFKSMKRALNKFLELYKDIKINYFIMDGCEDFGGEILGIPLKAEIKADLNRPGCSAASVLAKVARDKWMEMVGVNYKEYNIISNKGYSSRGHIAAIVKYGPSDLHRTMYVNTLMKNLMKKGIMAKWVMDK
ncbi:MAG: ribonuclease HII [Nanoarchaeota archaeon]